MPSRSLRTIFSLIIALVLFPCSAFAESWWGRKLPDQPTDFIFGYGSLINSASRNTTASAPIPAIPVRISAVFGYIRSWNDRVSSGFTALGLRKPHPGEQASTINGVIYPVDEGNMDRYDAREQGYVRVEIPPQDIEAVSWERVPESGHIWVYVPKRQDHAPGEDLPDADAGFPMIESYIDVVIEGALEYGPNFARELIDTTADWSQFWLDDRELARRPWVHDPKYEMVDGLLATIAPASIVFPDRSFTGPYIARWLVPVKR